VIDRLRRGVLRRGKRTAAAPAAADWRAIVRRRVAIATGLLALWAVGIEARLVYLQIINRAFLVERAERQQQSTQPLASKRGDILDRRGHVLATSVDADTIYAVPSAIADAGAAVAGICTALGDCAPKERRELVDRLLQKRRHFAYVRRQVTPDEKRRVEALNIRGVGFLKESRRFYPNKELAAHLLGFVGLDNKGLAGIEFAYDAQIRGKEGQILVYTDARGAAFNRFERPPTAGSTIELTIDEYLQHIAERELRAGMAENRAASGSVVVMDPKTGEILAMANEPTFNPNAYRDFAETTRRNRAVQDLYEPGSTFKVVTASAALEEKMMPTDAWIDTGDGQIRIGSRVIRDTHAHPSMSFTDVIVRSSNVGAIRIGLKLGSDRMSDYVQRFGFGRPISPDFPAENPGIVWDRTKLNESALASVSMGYQVGVTPLQMAAAVSSVANGGEYVEPRLVRAAYRDDRRYTVRSKVLRRTISAETASSLTAIMEQVVEEGTATRAKISGYTIAGKTGTANTLVNGRYSNNTYASFVGFLPSRDPKLTILVMLDSPRGRNGHYGGPVAAPIFRRIAEAALRYRGIPPTVDPAPPVLVPRDAESVAVAAALPPPGAAETPLARVIVDSPPGTMPDVRGMSARDATRTLVKSGVSPALAGTGFVVSQNPAPGEPIGTTGVGRLTLSRVPVRHAAVGSGGSDTP
jgi:cell division protein FtsI (penicillin-binding protein 3)